MSSSRLRKVKIAILQNYDDTFIEGVYHAAVASLQDIESVKATKLAAINSDTSMTDDEKSELADFLGRDSLLGEQVVKAAEELVVVGFFKTIESAIRGVSETSGLFSEAEVSRFYRFAALQSIVKAKASINIKSLPGYEAFNELRCLNEVIKQQGKVNAELAVFGWKHGEELTGLWDGYNRVKPELRFFVDSFAGKIIAQL